MIALNEEAYLPSLLDEVVGQTYPHELIEVVLVDSGSTDRTRALMEDFAARGVDEGFLGVVVADNPEKIQACGWNVAIEKSSGAVMLRVDAHASIPPTFVEANMAVLAEGEAVCGGPRPTAVKHPTPWQETLHLAEESAFGSSAASYRGETAGCEVPSVFHGAYRREVLDAVGGFDKRLRRTEDNEFHYRIRQKGYRIWFDPRIRSVQYVRSSFRSMLKQKYGNGYWIGRTLFIEPHCFQMHHFVPLVFVLGIIALALAGCVFSWIPFGCCVILYALLCIALSVVAVRSAASRNATMTALPVIFMGIHVSYGIGTLVGIVVGGIKRLMPHEKA
ncbi:MAG: glycosyltransferase family 2 protein [Raoultibacter sp.]